MGYMATDPEGLKRWLEIHNHSQQKGAPAQAQRTTITFDKLATIRVPTLLMPGDQDIQCPPWVMRRQFARIPGDISRLSVHTVERTRNSLRKERSADPS